MREYRMWKWNAWKFNKYLIGCSVFSSRVLNISFSRIQCDIKNWGLGHAESNFAYELYILQQFSNIIRIFPVLANSDFFKRRCLKCIFGLWSMPCNLEGESHRLKPCPANAITVGQIYFQYVETCTQAPLNNNFLINCDHCEHPSICSIDKRRNHYLVLLHFSCQSTWTVVSEWWLMLPKIILLRWNYGEPYSEFAKCNNISLILFKLIMQ